MSHGIVSRHYPSTCLERLTETKNNPSQYSRSLDRDLYPGPPEYEEGVGNMAEIRTSTAKLCLV
jgi:hypothetical protein